MKILSKQNFNQNESKNFVVDNLSSAPSNPILGQVYYNTQDERAYVCIKSGETPEWADLSLQEEVSIGGEEPNGRDMKIWINPEDITSSSDYGSLPIGSIIPYSGTTAPEGYSICDGKELNRETYKELFSIIGTTFGNGDGTSTFNLPDLKGRVSVGLDSSDTNFNTIGKTGGEKTHKLTVDEMPSHRHGNPVAINNGGNAAQYRSLFATNAEFWSRNDSNNATASTGGDQAHNNLQPYIVLNYIIKIYGEAMLTGDVIDSLEGDSSYNAPSIHAVNTKIKELEAYSSTAINEINSKFIYSSEEVVIGTWFGKTLYRKTFYRQSLINGMDEIVNHGIQNVDKIWVNPSKSFAIWPNGMINSIPFVHPDSYANGIFVSDFTSTSYRIKSGIDRSNISGYITLEYTKNNLIKGG